MGKKGRGRRRIGCFAISGLMLAALILSLAQCAVGGREKSKTDASARQSRQQPVSAEQTVESFARQHGLSVDDWPASLIELLSKNPETRDFVLNYPFCKDKQYTTDLSEYESCDEVPLFMQWDERWGYSSYSGELFGLSGCGPTCLSMVCVYLKKDATYTPRYVADFAAENGYSVCGSGSAWTLISQGGKGLGLDVRELPLDENTVDRELDGGHPVICIMGPGDFTSSGHFIVLCENEGGKIRLNDPNSKSRSERLWDYEELEPQIKNLWAVKNAE